MTNISEKKALFFIILLNFLLYFHTLFFGFVWDDIRQIVFNDRLIEDIKDLSFLYRRVGENVSYYRPIFFLSLALDGTLFNGSPFGFHFGNIILQIFIVVFLFKLLRTMDFDNKLSFVTVLVFSIHPSHSEAVSWVSARNELLYSLFGVISFYFYIKKSYLSYPFFLLSLLSKETAVVFPLLFLSYEIIFKGRLDKKGISFIFLYFLFLMAYFFLRKSLLPEPFGDTVPISLKVYTIINNIAFYLKKMFFPFNLKIFYGGLIKFGLDRELVISLFLVLLFLIIFYFSAKLDRRLLFFVLWFLFLILPISGIVITSTITYGSDRYLYLPSLGLSFFVAYFINKFSPNFFFVTIILTITLLGGYSIKRTLAYKDQQTFINEALRDAPSDPLVLNEVGVYYYLIGDLDKAENIFKKVISLNPRSYGGYYDLGRVLYDKGRYLEAKENFFKAMDLKPELAYTYYFLGEIYLKEKNIGEAEKFFLKTLEYEKDFSDVYNRLGEIEVIKGNFIQALHYFKRAYSIDPSKEYLHNIKKVEAIINSSSPYK